MEAIQIIYAAVLLSSSAFGLEALLLAFGGKLMVLYRRKRKLTLALATLAGLAATVPAVLTSVLFGFGVVYFGAVLFLYLILVIVVARLFGPKSLRAPSPEPPKISEGEMIESLEKRGLGDLVKKSKRKRRG
ncbi:MAG: hypothetical protein AB1744_09660 [Candidatus Zixiibacteriota bacterium]